MDRGAWWAPWGCKESDTSEVTNLARMHRGCEVQSHGFNFISLVTNHIEHLFMYLLAVCLSSLDKCLFISFVLFKIGLS